MKEAADYLRTTGSAIYKRIKRKQIPAMRINGSQILIRRQDLDHILDRASQRSYDGNASIKWSLTNVAEHLPDNISKQAAAEFQPDSRSGRVLGDLGVLRPVARAPATCAITSTRKSE